MSYSLILFPTPLDAQQTLTHDTAGWQRLGVRVQHWSGRWGLGFDIPETTPQGNGYQLTTTAPNRPTVIQRGVLWMQQPGFAWPFDPRDTAILTFDDVVLPDPVLALPPLAANGHFFGVQVP